MKFLILRFSSIGDIVLTTPVIRCLRKKYPDAEIHYATKKAFHAILKHNPYINKIHLLNNSTAELVEQLKTENFDYIIDLHHNQRTWLIKMQLGVKSFSFNKANFEKWIMVNLKVDRLPPVHIVDRYLDTLERLGVENDGEGLDYFLSTEDEVLGTKLPEALQTGYIAWIMGAKQGTKKFPTEKIIQVLQQMSYPVLLLGGKEDEEGGSAVRLGLSNRSNVYNACGKFSLNGSASLVKQAKLVVTNDTGLMHIAAAFKKPTISIWGNTIPGFGMYSYYGKHVVANAIVEVKNLNCRPCHKIGYGTCPLGHFKCMNDIGNESLAAVIKDMFTRL